MYDGNRGQSTREILKRVQWPSVILAKVAAMRRDSSCSSSRGIGISADALRRVDESCTTKTCIMVPRALQQV